MYSNSPIKVFWVGILGVPIKITVNLGVWFPNQPLKPRNGTPPQTHTPTFPPNWLYIPAILPHLPSTSYLHDAVLHLLSPIPPIHSQVLSVSLAHPLTLPTTIASTPNSPYFQHHTTCSHSPLQHLLKLPHTLRPNPLPHPLPSPFRAPFFRATIPQPKLFPSLSAPPFLGGLRPQGTQGRHRRYRIKRAVEQRVEPIDRISTQIDRGSRAIKQGFHWVRYAEGYSFLNS